MIVGPTVLRVTNGNGAPACCTSSKKMNCSTAERPCPPYSFGQPIPSQPSVPHGPEARIALAWMAHGLGVTAQQPGEIFAQLLAE
jgi:hypothetical protein